MTLNAATQSYSDTTGRSVVTITADALKAITGNGSSELILANTAATFDTVAHIAAGTDTTVFATGFNTLGINGSSSGIFDLSVLTGFTAIDVTAAATATFSNVAMGTGLALDAGGSSITYKTSDTNGASDSVPR